MSKTRDASGREIMGWLEGGYETPDRRARRAHRELGGEIHAGTSVDSDRRLGGTVDGLDRRRPRCGSSITCCARCSRRTRARLLSPALAEQAPADHCRYLGVICVLLRTSRSISPYYTLNITDRRIPLTTVVETTHVVDPAPPAGTSSTRAKYVDPSHPDLKRPAEDVEADYIRHVREIFPDLRDDEILDVVVQRARGRRAGAHDRRRGAAAGHIPGPGLALASTAHVYPEIVNGQAVIGIADRAGREHPRAASRRDGRRPHDLEQPFRLRASASLRSAVVAPTGRRDRRARPPLRAARRLTWGAWGDLGQDTGYDLVAGSRVAHGQLPYVDFVYYYGPLAPFVLGLAAWIGGAGVGPAIAVGLASRVVDRRPDLRARAHLLRAAAGGILAGAIVAGVAFAPTNFSFVLPHTETATFGIACLLVFVLGLGLYESGGTARWLVAAESPAASRH